MVDVKKEVGVLNWFKNRLLMRRYTYKTIFVLLLLFSVLGFAAGISAQESIDIPEKALPRFHKVSEDLYRGGQPEKNGFEILKKMGIKTVVNFRENIDEQPVVRNLGMELIHIPLTARGGIDDRSIREFFSILNNPDNYPVFVHCKRGADRTGAMIAFYRIAFEGWDPEKAYKEARDIGLRWWYFKLRKQIRNFNPEPFSDLILPK